MPTIQQGRITAATGKITFVGNQGGTELGTASNTGSTSMPISFTVQNPSSGIALFDSASQIGNAIVLALRNVVAGPNVTISVANGLIMISSAGAGVMGPTGPTGPTGSSVTGPTGPTGPTGGGAASDPTNLVFGDGTNTITIIGSTGSYSVVTPTEVTLQAETIGLSPVPLTIQPSGGTTNFADKVGIGGTHAGLTPEAMLDIKGNTAANSTAVAATSIDCSTANYFTKTISDLTSFTFDNAPANRVFNFIIILTNGGSVGVTWPVNVKWPNGVVPTLTASGTDILNFLSFNGGTTWYGALIVRNAI